MTHLVVVVILAEGCLKISAENIKLTPPSVCVYVRVCMCVFVREFASNDMHVYIYTHTHAHL